MDIGARPTKDHSVDRLDNSKGYGPTNCAWKTSQEQASNRDTNVWLEYRGKRQTISQWAEELNIPFSTFSARVQSLFKDVTPKNQKIQQLDVSTDLLINTFENGKDASAVSGVSQAAIRKCLCGHNRTAGGFKWTYVQD